MKFNTNSKLTALYILGLLGLIDIATVNLFTDNGELGLVVYVFFTIFKWVVPMYYLYGLMGILKTVISISMLPAIFVYASNYKKIINVTKIQEEKRNKISKKIFYTLFFFIFCVVVLMIFNAIKIRDSKKEWLTILDQRMDTLQEIKDSTKLTKNCKDDLPPTREFSGNCFELIQNVLFLLENSNNQFISLIEEYYRDNNMYLTNSEKNVIQDMIGELKSGPAFEANQIAKKYYLAYLHWHTYFYDVVFLTGIDNLSSEEIAKIKFLAQEVVFAEESVAKLKQGTVGMDPYSKTINDALDWSINNSKN